MEEQQECRRESACVEAGVRASEPAHNGSTECKHVSKATIESPVNRESHNDGLVQSASERVCAIEGPSCSTTCCGNCGSAVCKSICESWLDYQASKPSKKGLWVRDITAVTNFTK